MDKQYSEYRSPVSKLIKEVSLKPVLYDPHNNLYKDNQARLRAWQQIAEKMKMPGTIPIRNTYNFMYLLDEMVTISFKCSEPRITVPQQEGTLRSVMVLTLSSLPGTEKGNC